MATPLFPIIAEEIESNGFMRLDRYMALALGHPSMAIICQGAVLALKGISSPPLRSAKCLVN